MPIGDPVPSQKYFGENYDELKAAIDGLKANPPDFSAVESLFDKWLSGGGEVGGIGMTTVNDQHFFTQAQFDQWQEEVDENGTSYTWPDVTGMASGLVYITSAGLNAEYNLDRWMSDLHAISQAGGGSLQPLLDAVAKIRHWHEKGGRK